VTQSADAAAVGHSETQNLAFGAEADVGSASTIAAVIDCCDPAGGWRLLPISSFRFGMPRLRAGRLMDE